MDAEGWDAILTLAGPGELTLHSFRRRCSISVVPFIEIRWGAVSEIEHQGDARRALEIGSLIADLIQNQNPELVGNEEDAGHGKWTRSCLRTE